jgi:hypothetical protein
MKTIITYLFVLTLLSCSKSSQIKNDLELEILNDTLVAFSYDLKKDSTNILSYCIINNSDNIYYFKQGFGNDFLDKKVYKNGLYLSIFETSSNKEVNYSDKLPFEHQNKSTCDSCNNLIQSTRFIKEIERLGENDKLSYYMTKDKRHFFFIYPKEKLFFKQYINLTDSMRYEDTRFNYAHLKRNIQYSSKFFIPSDSTDFKKEIPKDILKTIEANKVKVYHGIIESKNKVPVKVIE